MALREKILELVCKQCGVTSDKLSNETRFVEDLGADSLDQVELVLDIEDAFDISIPDAAAEQITTIGNVVAYVEKVLAA